MVFNLTIFIVLALGLLLAFFGLKVFKVLLPLLGFVFGFSLASRFSNDGVNLNLENISNMEISTLLIPIIVGIVFAILAIFFYKLGVALSLGILAFILTTTVLQTFTLSLASENVVALVAGIVVFFLSFIFGVEEYLVLFASALNGGFYLSSGIAMFVEDSNAWRVFRAADYSYDAFINNLSDGWQLFIILGGLTLAAIGGYYQFKTK